jgi:hypothetical protein
MAFGGFLLVTVVTGLLLVGAALAVGRARRDGRRTSPAGRIGPGLPTPAGSAGTSDADALGFGLVAALVVLGGVALLTDPVTVTFVFLSALVAGYFAWGIYSLARARGLPKAHSVGVSAWLFGVVLIGVVAVKLLLG